MRIFETLADHLAQQGAPQDADPMADTELSELALEPPPLRDPILARPGLRQQMLAMAEKFGLTAADIATPRWREGEILAACQGCAYPRACKWYLDGRATEFGPQHCPNAQTYADLASQKT